MAKRQTTSNSFYALAGALLFSFGLALLSANVKELAVQASTSLSSPPGFLGATIELALAGLRTVQTYFFDQSTFQAGLDTILLSLWPLILVIIGAILLHGATDNRFTNTRLARNFPSGEYESD